MKVKEFCLNCKNYERRRWSSSYKPATYHEIGISHVYAYCKACKKRCLDVNKAECKEAPKEKV